MQQELGLRNRIIVPPLVLHQLRGRGPKCVAVRARVLSRGSVRRAATLAAGPAGGSPAGGNCPVATVVIPDNGEGDQTVESSGVKVSGREASNSAGRNNGEPVSPEIVQRWECRAAVEPVKASASREGTGWMQRAAPRGRRGRHAGKDRAGKARNQSRVAYALPHSEGITYKPSNSEVVMCLRVGRMGPVKR
jgi:hypothetical protein